MSRPCVILTNARAGALHAHVSLEHMRQMVDELGFEAEIIGTHSADEMCHAIRQLVREGVEKLAVAGGDGTVALAVQELVHTDTALGIILQGTANNFATALRLPHDLPSALRVLGEGIVHSVDLGKVKDRYFTEAAGVGLFANALALYGVRTHKNFYRAVYALARLVLHLHAHRIRLITDGVPHSERAVMCTAANSFRMAYAVPIAPGARLTDGLLDVVVIGDLRQHELIPYYHAFRAQTHVRLAKVSTVRVVEIRIESRHPLNVHCDDRVVGTTPATITAEPGALKVIIDRL